MTKGTCPKCGGREFVVEYTASALVTFATFDEATQDYDHDAEHLDGDIEFDDNSWARCEGCGHREQLMNMTKD